eukprot:6205847-Pleurochrysis_carterae.AAC.3
MQGRLLSSALVVAHSISRHSTSAAEKISKHCCRHANDSDLKNKSRGLHLDVLSGAMGTRWSGEANHHGLHAIHSR